VSARQWHGVGEGGGGGGLPHIPHLPSPCSPPHRRRREGGSHFVRLPVAHNGHMPPDMRPTAATGDIFWVMSGSADLRVEAPELCTCTGAPGIEPSPLPPPAGAATGGGLRGGGGSVSDALVLRKVRFTATGRLMSTYTVQPSDIERIRAAVGDGIADRVTVYGREDSWPSGIATLTGRNSNRPAMNTYVAYLCCFFDSDGPWS